MKNTGEKIERAVALQKDGKLDEAEAVYNEILLEQPRHPAALHLLGCVAIERKDYARARELIEQALKERPSNPYFHHNIAFIHGALGNFEDAEQHYRKAVELKPDYAEAYSNLAGSVKFTERGPVLEAVEGLLGRRDLETEDRCHLHFAAGKIYDDLGDPGRAFYHYQRGNEDRRARFSPGRHRRLVREIIETYTDAFVKRRAGEGSKSTVPVFVVGMPRSGTSLVERILDSHPAVSAAGELPDIAAIASTFPDYLPHPRSSLYPACMAEIPAKTVAGAAAAYLQRVTGMFPEAERIVDKHPLNFLHLGMIFQMFARAKVIHLRRDPRDTCLSCYFQNFNNGQEYAFDLIHLGYYYREYDRLMNHWRAVLPGKFLDVRYEALVTRQEEVSREIISFCDLPWDNACLAFHRGRGRAVRTASRWQVRQPMYTSSIGRWKPYAQYLDPLLEILGPVIDTDE